jgi:acyl carrier protein
MDIHDFIKKIEGEFEEITPGNITPKSKFRDVLDWSSVNALTVIALVDCEYDVILTADDFLKSETIEDIFSIIQSKS